VNLAKRRKKSYPKAMSKLGRRLIKAVGEARAIARGEADPATYRVLVPADVDVRKYMHQPYPDRSDIFACKAAGRQQNAQQLSFSEKLAMLDAMRARTEPLRKARKAARRSKYGDAA
jgi:hypothetical protein